MLSSPWIAARAQLTPNRVAIESAGLRLDYAELHRRARSRAAALCARGLRPGDVCAVLLPNGIDFAVLLHAADLAGAVLLPLNTRLTPAELAFPLTDSTPRLLLHAGGELGERARDAGRRAIGVETVALQSLEPAAAESFRPAPRGSRDALAILYTSGTTGRPKGACLCRDHFLASALASALHSGMLPGQRWLACMPLFHVGGLSILVRSAIYGSTAVIHERFYAAAVDAALDADAIEIVSLTTTMLRRLLQVRGSRPAPPALRSVLLGGGPCPPALAASARAAGFPLAATYGLTEACSQVATQLPDERDGGLTPLPGLELRIADLDGAPLPAAQPGEIWIRGASVMRAYRTPDPANPRPDGWFRTGDIGSLDARGRLRVHDRRSDLIVSGGENVYPAEIEAVLAAHPGVAEAAVAGVPDAEFGRRPAAWFVPVHADTPPDARSLALHCRRELAGYKVPVAFYRVEDLPRNALGKVRRQALAAPESSSLVPSEQAAPRAERGARAPMAEDRAARVRELGHEHARVETEGDLAATMATLIADPVYEFQPVGGLLRGRAKVQRYYEHLIREFLPRVEQAEIVDEWCNENSLVQEFDVALRIDGDLEEHRVEGILLVEPGSELMTGERIWGGERVLRLMLGDLYDELEAIA